MDNIKSSAVSKVNEMKKDYPMELKGSRKASGSGFSTLCWICKISNKQHHKIHK